MQRAKEKPTVDKIPVSSSSAREKTDGTLSADLGASPSSAMATATLSKTELAERKKRQRRLKKLEAKDERQKTKARSMMTPPGQRIYPLPKRLKPLSLFIRIGALESDQDVIPQEYYDLLPSDDEETTGLRISPHPEVLTTRRLIHLEPELHPITEENGHLSEFDLFNSEELRSSLKRTSKRPNTIQLPLQSAMKKPDTAGAKKRPLSLRFLDPKDQRLYAAIHHGGKEVEETREGDLPSSIERLRLNDPMFDGRPISGISSATASSGDDSLPIARPIELLSIEAESPAPQIDTGFAADAESTEQSAHFEEWDRKSTGTLAKPQANNINKRKSPLFPRDITSGESSDVSGYEADYDDRIYRRGSKTTK